MIRVLVLSILLNYFGQLGCLAEPQFSQDCLENAVNKYLEKDTSLKEKMSAQEVLLEIRMARINNDTIPVISYLRNSIQLDDEYRYYLRIGEMEVLVRQTMSLPLNYFFSDLNKITVSKKEEFKKTLFNNDEGAFVTYTPSILLVNNCKSFEFYKNAQSCSSDIYYLDQF